MKGCVFRGLCDGAYPVVVYPKYGCTEGVCSVVVCFGDGCLKVYALRSVF